MKLHRVLRRRKDYRLPDVTRGILEDLLTWDITSPPLRDALRYHLTGMLEGEYNRGRDGG